MNNLGNSDSACPNGTAPHEYLKSYWCRSRTGHSLGERPRALLDADTLLETFHPPAVCHEEPNRRIGKGHEADEVGAHAPWYYQLHVGMFDESWIGASGNNGIDLRIGVL
ncbi:hypothetical protein KEM48_002204 [Puccinia striiformis f. sp. tritici PST-130]|uniref:Uncharacterized protein n=1 Tax=Puccinia striiformis f. sp. tritici PST-78 TaxID=1165861 RepID=A0A0L0W2A0_9BASI|nr:hypothetical protein H4Q26_002352 [Puccinia striiformis f. sp. tritici PST-130]KAI9605419.1 hypothetical protein KEM48_002204 [Puccinia striiformis f. sp. tritici PST-130]KNF05626.1 hypothetical protein PSTG_01434 [Puccinia striiformis f. sp. tritici PST-78]